MSSVVKIHEQVPKAHHRLLCSATAMASLITAIAHQIFSFKGMKAYPIMCFEACHNVSEIVRSIHPNIGFCVLDLAK